MKQNRLTALAAGALALSCSGCIIVDGSGDHEWGAGKSKIEEQEARNREAIAGLELGSSIDAVRAHLGEPDFSEALSRGGKTVRILRYRTHRSHSDGDTTVDETTALVFVDGELSGIGETARRELLGE